MPLAGAPDALNIPVDELRQRIGELDRSAQTVVSCGVGLRGHVAARILKQHGSAIGSSKGGRRGRWGRSIARMRAPREHPGLRRAEFNFGRVRSIHMARPTIGQN
jgi:hypothetical protein